MRREQVRAGGKQVSYLVSESPVPSDRRVQKDAPYMQPLGTVVLLHAFPLNAEMWQPQLDVVPAGWRMIAPDYRGFGQSSPSDSPKTTINDLAGDVIDLLDHLDIHEAVVAGCSMGGYVAFELLASAPNYVKGLVLIDTRAGADSEEGKAGRRKMLEKIDTGGSEVIASEMMPKLLGATSQRERPGLVKQVQQMIRSTDPAAIKMAVTAIMERKDMTSSLINVKVPALVIAGAEDILIPLAAGEEMHRAIPRSALEIIPLAGHLPNLEQATAFDVALQRFLGRF